MDVEARQQRLGTSLLIRTKWGKQADCWTGIITKQTQKRIWFGRRVNPSFPLEWRIDSLFSGIHDISTVKTQFLESNPRSGVQHGHTQTEFTPTFQPRMQHAKWHLLAESQHQKARVSGQLYSWFTTNVEQQQRGTVARYRNTKYPHKTTKILNTDHWFIYGSLSFNQFFYFNYCFYLFYFHDKINNWFCCTHSLKTSESIH